MYTAIRIFAMTVALAGLVSSSFASPSWQPVPSPVSAYSAAPGPLSIPAPCFPGMTCGPLAHSGLHN